MGNDGCIYWPPAGANHTLKFDPETQVSSLIEDEFENNWWNGGAIGPAGVIFYMPSSASTKVLVVDPLKEFIMDLQANLEQYPEELGRKRTIVAIQRAYDCAVTKFGAEQVF